MSLSFLTNGRTQDFLLFKIQNDNSLYDLSSLFFKKTVLTPVSWHWHDITHCMSCVRGPCVCIYSQTWVKDHLTSTTIILGSHFEFILLKWILGQRPPVYNGHYFWVPRVNVVHRFDCIRKLKLQFYG